LIVGGDSAIGGAVADRLAQAGFEVLATTRRAALAGPSRPFLDLAADPRSLAIPDCDVCVLAAAIAQIEACRTDPVGSARVNVDAAAQVAADVTRNGGFVLLLSTNQVFDGSRPFRRTDDPVSPVGAYGRQKAMAEARILALGAGAAVLRKTKVLVPGLPILKRWLEAARMGAPITAFTDMKLAPVMLDDALEATCRILSAKVPGIHHLSGDEDVSYHALARHLGEKMGLDADRIVAASAAAAGLPAETFPANTTLDCAGLATIGMETPSSRRTIAAILDDIPTFMKAGEALP